MQETKLNGAGFRSLREMIGFSQSRLAKEIGMTVEHISRIENGKVMLTRMAALSMEAIVRRYEDGHYDEAA